MELGRTHDCVVPLCDSVPMGTVDVVKNRVCYLKTGTGRARRDNMSDKDKTAVVITYRVLRQ